MSRYLLVLVLCTLAFLGSAQDDYRDTLRFEFPAHRHEVFLNLTPAALVLMAGESFRPRFSLGYRFHHKPNSAIRIWANYDVVENSVDDDKIVNVNTQQPGYTLRRINDVSEIRRDLRVGLQWFRPNSRISPLYGVDAFAGVQKREEYREFRSYELDTSLCANCFVPSLLIPDRSESLEATYLVAGLDFSIGALFKTSDRIWLILQWTPELSYLSKLSESQQGFNSPLPAASGLYFHLRGIELFGGFRF